MSSINDFSRVFERSFIGYDDVRRLLTQEMGRTQPNFPPYNIRKVSGTEYVIEMAVAGFGKDDIDILLEGDKLSIRGSAKSTDENNFLFQGIAARNFNRNFTVNEQVVVKGANIVNGILKVYLEHIVPEDKKPRRINISDDSNFSGDFLTQSKPQMLTEGSTMAS